MQDRWATAPTRKERDRIDDACEELVRRLRDDPLEFSESRDGDIRIAILSPLGVRFYIETEAQIVYITQAWLTEGLGGQTQ